MMIRKTGLLLVVIVPAAVLIGLYVFRNRLVTSAFEYSLESMLGSEVALEGVELEPLDMRAGFARLAVTDPGDPSRYLVVAGPGQFDLNGLQLFARKVIVEKMSLEGFSYDVPIPGYNQPAPAPESGGAAGEQDQGQGTVAKGPATGKAREAAAEGEDDDWSLDVPTPELDLKALEQELDVGSITGAERLGSLRALDMAQAGAEARLAAMRKQYEGLKSQERLDEIQGRVRSLDFKSKDPRKLQASLKELQEAGRNAKALRNDVQALAKEVKAEPGRLRSDYEKIERQVEEDVAAALRLVKLGGFSAEEIGALVFGPSVVERFNSVLGKIRQVRAALARDEGEEEQAAPRRQGRWIRFPVTARAYPAFLVEVAVFSGKTVDSGGVEVSNYTGTLGGLTSDARTYGKPLLLDVTAQSRAGDRWLVQGIFDHTKEPGSDRIEAKGQGLRLADLKLSGGSIPERATTESADVTLRAGLRGKALDAALRLDANQVKFVFGKEAAASNSALQRSIRELFADFPRVSLQATLSGTLADPNLSISSSLDKQFMERAGALFEKRRREAEARVRAEIEQQVAAKRAEVEERVNAQRAALESQVGEAQARLLAYEDELNKQASTHEQEIKQVEKRLKEEERKAKEKVKEKAKDEAEELLRRNR
jgi:uncharacterized protein (TIGR03545 family)